MTLLLAGLAAFTAAVIQRITGLGFVLVLIGPFVLLYGPTEGVTAAILLALVAAVVAVPLVWREVDWRRSVWLIWPGLLTAPLGILVSQVLPEPALLLLIGAMAVFALTAGFLPALAGALRGRSGAVAAGAAGGFMQTASGLSGPALAAHAVGDRWPQRSFTASVQVIFVVFSGIGVLLRGLPDLAPADTGILVGVTVLGIVAGTLAAHRVPATMARRAMLAIAWAGAVVVLVRGVIALAAGPLAS
ncbi:TSUP family transporter [Microbacterium sp. W1N]|uniref:TSUP family transporter n=1 Tax=Microbacterium festucae TaxID=2977531 RepID=UPI0021C093FF|nr:TSUP family transporter [Microbacterium festucae]MCT9818803.1 TSUP family transporter [Microbacterium festucae]